MELGCLLPGTSLAGCPTSGLRCQASVHFCRCFSQMFALRTTAAQDLSAQCRTKPPSLPFEF